MKESVVIDGKEFDLSEPFGVTVQGVNLTDYTAIREAFTTSIKGPKSQNNLAIFKHPNVIGIPDPEAYRSKRASVLSEGMPLIQNGSVQLVTFGNQINLNVIGKGVEFFNDIATKSLKDVTWGSSNTITYGGSSIVEYPAIESWINPDYSAVSPVQGSLNVEKQYFDEPEIPPFIQKSLVLEKIVEQAGYQFNDELLADYGHYTRSFISLQVPEGKRSHLFDGTMYVNEMMHDVNQRDFFKWVLSQYGCMITVIDNVVTLIPIKYIQNLKAQAPDWSDKIDLSTDSEIGYDTGYAQVNEWSYLKYDSDLRWRLYQLVDTNSGFTINDISKQEFGQVAGSNQNLQERRYTQIGFHPGMELEMYNSGGRPRKILYLPCFDGANGVFTGSYPMHDIIIPENGTTYLDGGGSPESWAGSRFNGGTGDANGFMKVAWWSDQEAYASVSNNGDDFGLSHTDHLLDDFFPDGATKFIREPLTVTAKFNLSSSDVKFFADGNKTSGGFYFERYAAKVTPIYCSHLNGHYVVSRISNYISGRSVEVSLIRI